MVREIKIGEEAEGPKGEGENWRNNSLEYPGGKQNGAIAPKLQAPTLVTNRAYRIWETYSDNKVKEMGAVAAHIAGPVTELPFFSRYELTIMRRG
jgi:hypothetical protein